MNGSDPSEGQRMGRVEICYNNTYGSVCDDFFNENAAAVVCNGTGESYLLSLPFSLISEAISLIFIVSFVD